MNKLTTEILDLTICVQLFDHLSTEILLINWLIFVTIVTATEHDLYQTQQFEVNIDKYIGINF